MGKSKFANEVKMNKHDLILVVISDLVAKFLFYDRKSDEDLGVGDIEKAIESGEISVDEMTARFAAELKEGLQS